jgi:hypothetical protein
VRKKYWGQVSTLNITSASHCEESAALLVMADDVAISPTAYCGVRSSQWFMFKVEI